MINKLKTRNEEGVEIRVFEFCKSNEEYDFSFASWRILYVGILYIIVVIRLL